MTTRTRSRRKVETGFMGCPYNSRLQKGGALLEDMRLLVRNWRDIGTNGQQDTVVAENLFGKHTRVRAADTLRRAYLPRFVNGRPPQAWKIVRALEDANLPVEILRPVYYWITVRNERLLYDFVCTELLHSRKSQALEYKNGRGLRLALHPACHMRQDSFTSTYNLQQYTDTTLDLQRRMREASHYGEIRELLDHGWRQFGVGMLSEQIKEALTMREVETRLAETRVAGKVGLSLSILFGLLAFPTFPDRVLRPLWELLRFPRPSHDAAFQVLVNGIAFALVALIVYGLTRRHSVP